MIDLTLIKPDIPWHLIIELLLLIMIVLSPWPSSPPVVVLFVDDHLSISSLADSV